MKKLSTFLEDIESLATSPVPSIPPEVLKPEEDELMAIGHELSTTPDNSIVGLLKNALCEEFNAWYQYIICHEFLHGNERTNIEEFYLEAAKDEFEDHACWLMKRIAELGGNLEDMYRGMHVIDEKAKHKYIIPSNDVKESLLKNIQAEEGAIETYKQIEQISRDTDPTTNSKIKEILADEEEHLQKLKDFRDDILKNAEI